MTHNIPKLHVLFSGEAERDSVIKSKGLLEKVNVKILGIVINKIDSKKKDYYYYEYEYGENSERHSHRKKGKKNYNKRDRIC